MIQCAQSIEQLEAANDRLRRWLVEEVEVEHIVDPQTLEHQDDHAEICSLDLRNGILQQLVPEGPFRV